MGYKNTGLGGGAPDKAGAEVELYADGQFEVRTSSAELGQGLLTVLQLIAAEELGQPPERVRVLLSDTDLTPDGGPTTASRQTYVTGNAVRHAAQALRQALASDLAEHYDVPARADPLYRGAGAGRWPIHPAGRGRQADARRGPPPAGRVYLLGAGDPAAWARAAICTSPSPSPRRPPRWKSIPAPAR